MQNKPNLSDTQINVSYVKTMNYEQKTMNNEPINKPNQTQFYPPGPWRRRIQNVEILLALKSIVAIFIALE